jgi:hypothetical protein
MAARKAAVAPVRLPIAVVAAVVADSVIAVNNNSNRVIMLLDPLKG